MKKFKLQITICFIIIILSQHSKSVYAQTPTPTAVPPDVNLPQGWGPSGPGQEISIQELTGSFSTGIINDPDLVCNAGLQLVRYCDQLIPPEWYDPVAVAKIRIRMSYSDGGQPWPARLRFAYHVPSIWMPFDVNRCLEIYSFDADGYTLLDSTTACFCNEPNDPTCNNTSAAPNLGNDTWENWRYFDNVITVNDHGYLWLVENNLSFDYSAPKGGFVISGLYLDKANNTFPNLCENIFPTPTTFPTWTPYPTWTATPTGTLTFTPTPTNSPTPLPTSAGQTSTPSPTSLPFYTWTPRPTTTAWPTSTPVYVSTSWLTPAGEWGTPIIPTLAPIATIPAISAGFTPNATYQARVESVSTSIAFGSIMETRMFTMTEGLISYTIDLDQYIVGAPDLETAFDPASTGTITNPKFTLKYLAMILAWFKGLMQYIPHLAPFLLAFLAAFLWRFWVVFVGFAIRAIAFMTSLLARIIELILEFLPL